MKKILSSNITAILLVVLIIVLSSYFFIDPLPFEVKCIENYILGIDKASVDKLIDSCTSDISIFFDIILYDCNTRDDYARAMLNLKSIEDTDIIEKVYLIGVESKTDSNTYKAIIGINYKDTEGKSQKIITKKIFELTDNSSRVKIKNIY